MTIKKVVKKEFFIVGGAVRNFLLGLPPEDFDIVATGFSFEEMKKMFGKPVGNGFPVFLGVVPGLEKLGTCEIAMARKEISTGPGYKDFKITFGPEISLYEDLKRRDFTINAIAMNKNGDLIDPLNGIKDLKNKTLRVIRPEAFEEDPLRILRLARFAAQLDFEVEPQTLQIAKSVPQNLLTNLPAERVWKELIKALSSKHPHKFFLVLKQINKLSPWFSELEALIGIKQAHHKEDAFEHTILVLKQSAKFRLSPEYRFALLCHDLGKALTPEEILPKHHGHEKRIEPVISLCKKLKAPNKFTKTAMAFTKLHMKFHRLHEMRPGKVIALVEEITKNNLDLAQILICTRCDAEGRIKDQTTVVVESFQKLVKIAKTAYKIIKEVTGKTLIQKGLKPGPDFGKQLNSLRAQKFALLLNGK